MVIRSLLMLLLLAVLLHDSESAPTPNKNDPFKPVYRLLKEYRKIQKYRYKYGGGSRGHRDNDSDESSEEYQHPFNGGGYRPTGSGSGNRPSIFPSSGSNGNGGSGSGGQRLPSPGSGGNSGSGDPFAQLNQGFSSFLQGLGSLSIGQLIGGGGGSGLSFPSK
ncbi:unnamed protein product [Orchesella dallaii]|uniref:Uncharacterized protein n=1 Tax=Orchesella dallaii TaxID=48710 RepID=A0ABP1S2M9_9HEXA